MNFRQAIALHGVLNPEQQPTVPEPAHQRRAGLMTAETLTRHVAKVRAQLEQSIAQGAPSGTGLMRIDTPPQNWTSRSSPQRPLNPIAVLCRPPTPNGNVRADLALTSAGAVEQGRTLTEATGFARPFSSSLLQAVKASAQSPMGKSWRPKFANVSPRALTRANAVSSEAIASTDRGCNHEVSPAMSAPFQASGPVMACFRIRLMG